MSASRAERKPLRIVLVGSLADIGDSIYRVRQPAAAMARREDVEVYEVHPLSRFREAAALAADVLVLFMSMDIEDFRVIYQRRLLGRPTFCEINDYFPDVHAWNPAARSWSDRRGGQLYFELMRRTDGTQFSTHALADRFRSRAETFAVFENHVAELPPPRRPGNGTPLMVGWGGSIGHLQDIGQVAPALSEWMKERPDVHLKIMGDPALAELFAGAPQGRFHFVLGGSLAQYLDFVATLDVGIAPLLATEYNRCRSDVKFLEYASRGTVSVLQRLEPYTRSVRDGETGFLFDKSAQMLAWLDALRAAPDLRRRVAEAAYDYVRRERLLDDRVGERIDFYRTHAARVLPRGGPVPEVLRRAAEVPLRSIGGWRELAPHHHVLDLHRPEEVRFAEGLRSLEAGDFEGALAIFADAARQAPDYYQAFYFGAHCLLKLGRVAEAQRTFERSAALAPLYSRPLRALARLHRRLAADYERRAAELNPPAEPGDAKPKGG